MIKPLLLITLMVYLHAYYTDAIGPTKSSKIPIAKNSKPKLTTKGKLYYKVDTVPNRCYEVVWIWVISSLLRYFITSIGS